MRNRETMGAVLAMCMLLLATVVPVVGRVPSPAEQTPARPEAADVRVDHAGLVAVEAAAQGRWLAAQATQERLNRAGAARRASRSRTARSVAQAGVVSERCGGSLPPCAVMMCESGGNVTARNPRSSASGKWQLLDSTWNRYGGYATAADAPEHVQDERARDLWNGGKGAGHWRSCL